MKNFIVFLLVSFVALSCKKDKNGPTGAGPAGGSPTVSSYTSISGTLISIQNLYYDTYTHMPDTMYSTDPWFFINPQNNWNLISINNTTSAGNVYLNNTKLALYNYPGFVLYYDSTGSLNLKNMQSWKVTGSSVIPAFTYTAALSWPAYTGFSQLQDTLQRTEDNVIKLANITGADSISITIDDGTGQAGHSYTSQRMLPSATTFTIIAGKIAGMVATNNATLSVSLFRFMPQQNLSGKNFAFLNDVEFQKRVTLK